MNLKNSQQSTENPEKPKTPEELEAETAAKKAEIEAKARANRMSLSGILGGALEGYTEFFKATGQVIKGFWESIVGKPEMVVTTTTSPEEKKEANEVKQKNEKKETYHGQFKEELTKLMADYGIADTGNDKHNFALVAAELGKEVEAKYGVPWQVVAAQACLESGFGASGLSQKNFNCFGIKAQKGYTGEFSNWNTAEFFDGQREVIKSNFRAYGSIRDSFMDYGRFLTENRRYAKAFEFASSPIDFLRTVIKSGYATDPNYVAKAQSAAAKYGINLS